MKLINYLFLASLIFLLGSDHLPKFEGSTPINPIIGDISYIETFGTRPDDKVDEQVRIQTHLLYVESLLRKTTLAHLSEQQRSNRMALLDHLALYTHAGQFPYNLDFPKQRKPCFIDELGNICAVGYLVEHSAGRELAEHINAQYKYEEVMNMEIEDLDQWAFEHGMEKEELAMIQPNYVATITHEISPYYGMGSALLNGINTGTTLISLAQWNQDKHPKWVSYVGIGSGVSTAVIGALKYDFTDPHFVLFNQNYVFNESDNRLSMANICIGTATALFHTYDFLSRRRLKKDPTSKLQIRPFSPNLTGAGFGLCLQKRF